MAFLRTKQLMEALLARHTGQPIERIQRDTDHDHYMDPEEASAYGMIDAVFAGRARIPGASTNGVNGGPR